MRNWYSISASADGGVVEVSIFDEIGFFGINARDFLAAVQAKASAAQTIRVLINSPGGSVIDALAIVNGMRRMDKRIEVEVLGVAASAASYIAMAGDHIVMPANTFMFLHNPIAPVYGNADDMREMAEVLDKFGATLTAAYASRWKGDEDKLKQVLADETWLTAAECLEYGLADEVTDPVAVTATYDLDRKMPDAVRAVFKRPEPPAAAEPPPVAAVAQAPALADDIKTLAEGAQMPALAGPLVLAADSIEAARAALDNARQVRALLAVLGEQAQESPAVLMTPLATVRAKLAAERAERDVPMRTTPAATSESQPPARGAGINVVAFWKQQQEKQA